MASWSRVRTDTENSEHMSTLESALTRHVGFSFVCLSLCAPGSVSPRGSMQEGSRAVLLQAEPQ